MEYRIGHDARCAVIGYGSWATAIVRLLTENNLCTGWYVRNPEVLESLRTEGRNPRYLSDVEFDTSRIAPSDDLDAVVAAADVAIKGKYILLDFWSKGCGPCVASIPELKEIEEQYKEQLEVVSISSDTEASWKEAVAELKLTGNQWNELRQGTTGLAAAYRVRGIPHYVLIAPDGKVKKMWFGYGKGSLKAKMKELIGE